MQKEENTKENSNAKPTEKPSSTKKPETTTKKAETTTKKPSANTTTTTTKPSASKPYFVSLELISIERVEKKYIDGMHVLDKIYGKNQCFQCGDVVKFRVNMSDGGNGFSVLSNSGCTVSVTGNIITAKVTALYGQNCFIQIETKNKNGEKHTPYVAYKVWDSTDINDNFVVREYAAVKGLRLLNGCSEEAFKRYNIKIPGNSNWLSQALAAIDDARRNGCTRYTYQIVYQDAFDMMVYK